MDADLAVIAKALRAERLAIEQACPNPAAEPSAWREAARIRMLRRLDVAELLPPWIAEAAIAFAVEEVQDLRGRRVVCEALAATAAAALAVTTDPPWCVRPRVSAELDAAALLGTWGHEHAARALADGTGRWDEADCPSSRAMARNDGASPTACSCGGRRTEPSWASMVGGGVSPVLYEFGLAYNRRVTSPMLPDRYCPTHCVAEGWGRPRRPLDMWTDATESVDVPGQPANMAGLGITAAELERVREAVGACEPGAAEFLGSWIAWDELPGSLCLADRLGGSDPGAWRVVESAKPR